MHIGVSPLYQTQLPVFLKSRKRRGRRREWKRERRWLRGGGRKEELEDGRKKNLSMKNKENAAQDIESILV